MYQSITENDRSWDEKLANYKYIGRTAGCGCCGEWEGLTRELLEEYISELESKLEKAKEILYSL